MHHVLNMPIDEAQARKLKLGDTVTLEKTLFGIRDAALIAMLRASVGTRESSTLPLTLTEKSSAGWGGTAP